MLKYFTLLCLNVFLFVCILFADGWCRSAILRRFYSDGVAAFLELKADDFVRLPTLGSAGAI